MDLDELRVRTELNNLKLCEESINFQIASSRQRISQNTEIGIKLASALEGDNRRHQQHNIYEQMLWKYSHILMPARASTPKAAKNLDFFSSFWIPAGRMGYRIVTRTEMVDEISSISINLAQVNLQGICIMGDSCVRIYDPMTGRCFVDWNTRSGITPNNVLCSTYFSEHPNLIVFGSEDGCIRIFDLNMAAIVEEWHAHSTSVRFLGTQIIDDCSYLISGSKTELAVWCSPSLDLVYREEISSPVVECGSAGENLVFVSENKRASLLNPKTGKLLDVGPTPLPHWSVNVCDYGIVVSAGEDSMVLRTERPVEHIDYYGDYIAAVCGCIVYIWQVRHQNMTSCKLNLL